MEPDISDRLELLYEPPQDQNTTNMVDLVFVHGTLGDHTSTWTHPETKTYWPRHLLPKDFPHVRILAFKYSPTVEDFFPYTTEAEQPPDQTSEKERLKASSDSLNVAASDLITAIAQFRSKSQRKSGPLILLGHSMGGLICIKTLFHVTHPLFESVFLSIQGFFLFGTPFMEDRDDTRWRDLGINLFRLRDLQEGRNAAAEPPNFHHDPVYNIVALFTYCADRLSFLHRLDTVYFCEELPVDIQGIKGYIVEEDAAVPLVGGTEDIGTATCIQADHISLCKYADADAEGYQRVREELGKVLLRFERDPGSLKRRNGWIDKHRKVLYTSKEIRQQLLL